LPVAAHAVLRLAIAEDLVLKLPIALIRNLPILHVPNLVVAIETCLILAIPLILKLPISAAPIVQACVPDAASPIGVAVTDPQMRIAARGGPEAAPVPVAVSILVGIVVASISVSVAQND